MSRTRTVTDEALRGLIEIENRKWIAELKRQGLIPACFEPSPGAIDPKEICYALAQHISRLVGRKGRL